MKSTTYTYRLDQQAPDNSPGFVLFRDMEDGHYYIHFNDKNGKPLFFSKPYFDNRKQKNGLQTLQRSRLKPRLYKIHSEGDKHFFVLKAGNHKEIGRSRDFDSLEKAEAEMNRFTQKKGTEPSPKKSKAAKTDQSGALKYHFRIELYPQRESGRIDGKIINVSKGRKEQFSGLDREGITRFILDNLAEADKKLLEQGNVVPAPKPTQKPKRAKKLRAKKTKPPKVSPLEIELKAAAGQAPKKNWQSGKTFLVCLKGRDKAPISKGESVPVQLKIEPLQNSKYRISRSHKVISSNTDGIQLDSLLSIPVPGLYYLKVESNEMPFWAGKTLVNVV